jgi:DNA helicase-2/ATP-dependent DNA helicase PcrA
MIVDYAMDDSAEYAARLILNAYRIAHPQWTSEKIPIDDLVQWMGLTIGTFHPDDYPPGVYGYVDSDEDEDLIWLRRDLAETFRRFTLAHELGHAVLHCHGVDRLALFRQQTPSVLNLPDLPGPSRVDPCAENDIQEQITALADQEQMQEVLGIGQSYDPRSQCERAANIFAAELLLPRERVLACYTQAEYDRYTLAACFGVSQAALLNRLASLLKSAPHANSHSNRQTSPCSVLAAELASASIKPPAKDYDEFQRAAIEASTPVLIVAGPGSGKTSTLIGRITHLTQTLGVPAARILALTFSRKAALEMEERLALLVGNNRLSIPKISTFHAFCADILRQYGSYVGLRSGFTLLDDAEGYFLLRQQANKMRLYHYQNLQYPMQYFPDMLKAISRAKDELVTPYLYAALAQQMLAQAQDDEERMVAEKALEVAHVYQLYEQALVERGDCDFGGLLMLTLRLFREQPAVLREFQSRYQHILVDEFQDVNRASGVLLRELAGPERHVWVVGDANQAIYGFRGASPANISQFEQDFPAASILPLSRNYRSRPDLVALAESFRCQLLEAGQSLGKNQPVCLGSSDKVDVTLAVASNDSCEVAGLIDDIRSKLAAGYRYQDIVVLCRTRSQVQKLTRALAQAGLPVIERSGMLEQEYIKDLLSLLLILVDPSGQGLLRLARQPGYLLSQPDLEALFLTARDLQVTPQQLIVEGHIPLSLTPDGQLAFQRLSSTVQTLYTLVATRQISDIWTLLTRYLFFETPHIRAVLSTNQSQPDPRLADYDCLLQLARHFDQLQMRKAGQSTGEQDAQTLLDSVEDFLAYLRLLVVLRQEGAHRQANEEESAPANILRVMTVHASKGLEFPVVYMPELVQQRFPLRNQGSAITHPRGMLSPASEGKAAHESGEACLFYVGVTRARDHLVLSYSERYGKRAYKRSLYLDALEAGLAPERILRCVWEAGKARLQGAASPLPGGTGERTGQAQSLRPPSFLPPAAAGGELAWAKPMQKEDGHPSPTEPFIRAMCSANLSASAIEAYLRCPRQYAYSYIYHFSTTPDGYRLFRQATQKIVEEVNLHFRSTERNEQLGGNGPSSEEVQERYILHWQELGGHEEPFAPMYERHGQEIMEAVRQSLVEQGGESWELRYPLTVEVAGKTIHVVIDRVETVHSNHPKKRFVRTHLKGKKQKELPEPGVRELLYTLAYRQYDPDQAVELHHLDMSTGERMPLRMSAKKEQSLNENVQQAIEGLERNDYAARPAKPFRCPQCPFFFICPA